MNSTDAPQMIEYVTKVSLTFAFPDHLFALSSEIWKIRPRTFAQSLNFTPHDTKWIPGSARVVCCGISPGSTGALNVYELERDGTKEIFTDLAFGSQGIKCSTFGASRLISRHLAMGDYGGSISICDLERAIGSSRRDLSQDEMKNHKKECEIFSSKGHDGIINAIDGIGGTSVGPSEIATGGKDGCVKVWDPRVDCAVVTLGPDKSSNARDCWAVAFGNSYNNEERSILAGFDNGDIKLFDLRTNTMRWEAKCKNGVTSVQFDRPDIEMNKLVVCTLESKFRCYDMRTQHPSDGFACLSERAHRSTVWISKHLPQNRDLFMTGGGNGGFNIYKYHYPKSRVGKHRKDCMPVGVAGTVELLNSRIVSTQPIISFDWSPDREGLCCMSSLDQTLKVFIVTRLEKH